MSGLLINTKFSISLALLIALATFSYVIFSQYKPVSIIEFNEVKGASTEKALTEMALPQPLDAENISTNSTADTKQITFTSKMSGQEIHNFYKNALGNDWRLTEESVTENLFARQYKKDETFLYIWTSKNAESNLTYASIEILNHEK